MSEKNESKVFKKDNVINEPIDAALLSSAGKSNKKISITEYKDLLQGKEAFLTSEFKKIEAFLSVNFFSISLASARELANSSDEILLSIKMCQETLNVMEMFTHKLDKRKKQTKKLSKRVEEYRLTLDDFHGRFKKVDQDLEEFIKSSSSRRSIAFIIFSASFLLLLTVWLYHAGFLLPFSIVIVILGSNLRLTYLYTCGNRDLDKELSCLKFWI